MTSRSSGGEGPCCQVPGCRANVVKEGHYFVRRKVCRKHCTADEICVGDNVVRYCQQCSRVQPIDDFDAGRRSCRASLAAHSQRRRNRGVKAAHVAAAATPSPATTGSAGGSGHNSQQTNNTSGSEVPPAISRGSPQAAAAARQDARQAQRQQQQEGVPVEAQELEEEPWLLPLHMPPLHQMLALPQSPQLQPSLRPAAQQQPRAAPSAAAAGAAARPQLDPGSVADALIAAISTDMNGSAPGYSMQGQQHTSTSAAFYGAAAAGARDAAHRAISEPPLLSGTKRGREPTSGPYDTAQYLPDAFLGTTDEPSTGAGTTGFLQSVSNSSSMLGQSGALAAAVQQQQQQQRQQQRLRLQQQQQQMLSRQPPRMPQPAGSESLRAALLSLRAALLSSLSAGLASSQGTEQDQPWPQQRPSSGGSGSSSNAALQRLVAALRTMPNASNVPALQLAVERQRQQQQQQQQQLGSRQQPGMSLALAQSLRLQPSNLMGPSLSSPSVVAGASLELSPSALTAPDMLPARPRAHQQDKSSSSSSDGDTGPTTTLQRLTAVLKSLPPGGLPLLKAALQEAEQTQQEAALEEPSINSERYGLANDSQARLQAASLLGQQHRAQSPQQGAVSLQQQHLAAGANLQRLLLQQQQQQRMAAAAVARPPQAAGAGAGADCRPAKRQALSSTAGALRPAGVDPALQQLLLGSAAAGGVQTGLAESNTAQPRANRTFADAPGVAIRPGHDRLMIEDMFPDNYDSLGTTLSGAPGYQG